MDTAALPESGDLAELPTPRLLMGVHAARFDGTLALERGRLRKRLGFEGGALVDVETSLPSESLCTRLRAAGTLDAATVARVQSTLAERGCSEAAALAGLRILDARALLAALRARAEACAQEAIAWASGRFALEPEAAPREAPPALRTPLPPLVRRGLAAHWPPERLVEGLRTHFHSFPHLAEAASDSLASLAGDDPRCVQLVAALDGSRTLESVIGLVFDSPAALATLWIADAAGLLRYAAAPPGAQASPAAPSEEACIEIEVRGDPAAAGPAAAQPPAGARPGPSQRAGDPQPAAAPAGRPAPAAAAGPSPEAEALRKEVLELHEQLGSLDHYGVLGVERDATPAAIKKAYFKAAKRFHPDKLARLGLDAIKEQAAEVFAAFAEANEVLGDAERRRAYDEQIDSGGADAVDLSRLAQAEAFYRKAEVLVRMGNFRDAAPMLRSAVELWPDECIYQATLGWALFKKSPSEPEAARDALARAVAIDDGNARAHFWLGLVQRATGDVNDAARSLARARELDPAVG